MFDHHSKLIFPKIQSADGGVADIISQLIKNLEYHGMDCTVEKNMVYFAGNPAKFNHLDPLDNISGEVEIVLENEKLIFSVSIS
jgi:hypothetical protein